MHNTHLTLTSVNFANAGADMNLCSLQASSKDTLRSGTAHAANTGFSSGEHVQSCKGCDMCGGGEKFKTTNLGYNSPSAVGRSVNPPNSGPQQTEPDHQTQDSRAQL